ncbi:MAG: hypothetical protein NZM12_11825, partial [Steroidobacteraceae bacterium]|nr:hypothetical protein [Steroidobacteraceae bacterium]MDW8258929.1 hypothetical protein [Gammaproteobacteria bacterium]
MLRCRILSVCISIAAAATVGAAQTAPPENTGPNNVILRRIGGSYEQRTLQPPTRRVGREDFVLLAHHDSTRTLIAWTIDEQLATHSETVLRVGPDFRPLEAFIGFWSDGAHRAGGLFRVDGELISGEL